MHIGKETCDAFLNLSDELAVAKQPFSGGKASVELARWLSPKWQHADGFSIVMRWLNHKVSPIHFAFPAQFEQIAWQLAKKSGFYNASVKGNNLRAGFESSLK